jgi:hypothetical protein
MGGLGGRCARVHVCVCVCPPSLYKARAIPALSQHCPGSLGGLTLTPTLTLTQHCPGGLGAPDFFNNRFVMSPDLQPESVRAWTSPVTIIIIRISIITKYDRRGPPPLPQSTARAALALRTSPGLSRSSVGIYSFNYYYQYHYQYHHH